MPFDVLGQGRNFQMRVPVDNGGRNHPRRDARSRLAATSGAARVSD